MRILCPLLLCLLTPTLASSQPSAAVSPAFKSTGMFFAVSVGDIDASANWYAQKLGMKVVMDPPKFGSTRIKVLEGGGLMVELIQDDAARPLGVIAPGIKNDAMVHGITKAGVIVEDWDKLLTTLKERGVDIFMGPFPPRREQRANLVIKDNSGNLIQFFGKFADPAAK